MKKPNVLKQHLKNGETIRVLWTEMGSPGLAEAAVHSGWPFILVDNEHGTASLETMLHMVRAIEAAGGHPIVRIPWNDQVYLKRILDLGVQSLMVPMICDRQAAEDAVAASRYPPHGRRGYAAPIVRASQYGMNAQYIHEADDELLLIAQIEHVDAIPNIQEIASVDGIDMLFIGPNDLCGSIGKLERLDEPDTIKMISDVEGLIRASGKLMGSIPRPGMTLEELKARGHRIIAGPSDIGCFMQAASETAREWDDMLAC